MAATELRNKAIYLFIFVGMTVLILLSLPAIELWLQTSVLPQFGMHFVKGWELTPESHANAMHGSYVNAIDSAFRILKILLWMAVVVAIVRFLAVFILKTAYRTS